MHPARDQPRHVRNVRHQNCAHTLRNLRRAGEIVGAGVGRRADHNDLGPVLARQHRHLVVVQCVPVSRFTRRRRN